MMETWTNLIVLAMLVGAGFLLMRAVRGSLTDALKAEGAVRRSGPRDGGRVGQGLRVTIRSRELHFCSDIFLAKFEANPEQFIADSDEP